MVCKHFVNKIIKLSSFFFTVKWFQVLLCNNKKFNISHLFVHIQIDIHDM